MSRTLNWWYPHEEHADCLSETERTVLVRALRVERANLGARYAKSKGLERRELDKEVVALDSLIDAIAGPESDSA